jgi:hypothetical protein
MSNLIINAGNNVTNTATTTLLVNITLTTNADNGERNTGSTRASVITSFVHKANNDVTTQDNDSGLRFRGFLSGTRGKVVRSGGKPRKMVGR